MFKKRPEQFFFHNHQGYYIKKNYKINNRNKIQDITNKKNLEKQRDKKKKKPIRYNRNKETRKQDLEQYFHFSISIY